jgi:hypothetical protein
MPVIAREFLMQCFKHVVVIIFPADVSTQQLFLCGCHVKHFWIGLFTIFMILESLKMSVYPIKLFVPL